MAKYRVIKVMDSYSVLINYGFANNAEVGDKLRICIPGDEIKDPETDITIGTLDKIKDVVQVVTPYENFSLCQKVSTRIVDVLNPLSALTKTIATQKKLNTNCNDDKPVFDIHSHDPIIVGDIAILLP